MPFFAARSPLRFEMETSHSCPTVRTVLRITDDLELSEQTRSTGSDDLVKQVVGTRGSEGGACGAV